MSPSVSQPMVPSTQLPFVWLLRSYQQAIATIKEQEMYIQSMETTLHQNLNKYHEAMGQYHQLRQQFDHQYSTQYQQYFALPIPCYTWQWLDGQLQLIDFNPAAARFSGDRLHQPMVALGHQPERLFLGLPALSRYLLESYSAQTSCTYHLAFEHLQLYLQVDYVYLEPDQMSMFVADESEQVLREQQLRQKAKQQSAIARLGQLGLATEVCNPTHLDRLLRQAVTSVARILALPFASIYQRRSPHHPYGLVAGYGWGTELVGQVTLNGAAELSHGGYVLGTKEMVIIKNLTHETRFQPEPLLINHNIVSGVGLLIGTEEQAWGVLAVYNTESYEFSADQLNFLRAIANILATVQTCVQCCHWEQ